MIVILASVAAGAILITNGINSAATHLRRGMPAIVTTEGDIDALLALNYSMDEIRQGYAAHLFDMITYEMAEEIASLPYVRYFDYRSTFVPLAYNFDLVSYTPTNLGGWTSNDDGTERYFPNLACVSRPEFPQISEEFWFLEGGRLFLDDEMYLNSVDESVPVLISSGKAQSNDLHVGSIITLYVPLFELPDDANVPVDGFVGLDLEEIQQHPYNQWLSHKFDFEVVGVLNIPYEPTREWEEFSIQLFIHNQLITPNWWIQKINQLDFESNLEWARVFNQEYDVELSLNRIDSIEPIWVLHDLAYFDAFQNEAQAILPDFYLIEDLSFQHRQVMSSMDILNLIANQVLIFSIGAILIVLTLVILLYLRERKEEIGIYLALGEKKIKIILQILFEVFAIAIVGIVSASFIGYTLSNLMSESLLRDALVQHQATACPRSVCWEPIGNLEFRGFGSGQMEIDELIEIFDVSLDIPTFSVFYGIGLLTVMLSTIVPVIYILELKPKEVLMGSHIR